VTLVCDFTFFPPLFFWVPSSSRTSQKWQRKFIIKHLQSILRKHLNDLHVCTGGQVFLMSGRSEQPNRSVQKFLLPQWTLELFMPVKGYCTPALTCKCIIMKLSQPTNPPVLLCTDVLCFLQCILLGMCGQLVISAWRCSLIFCH
jgi:hypothetical protein